ncbi:molecular chaperone DnaJ [Neisseria sicca]|uniref:molecular chaperone DnaJ n=1 Tax=Neisseria sicca TaxID=490 RepID=UPI000D3218BF|nr:molecular chaperone DnaJ [Neisseria sicca]
MTIDDLLARWGFWRSVRDDNGLGYATSAANRAMAGDANTGGTRPLLPYGVDADSVFSAVDRVVMKELPAFHREVLLLRYSGGVGDEYKKVSVEKAMAEKCGCCVRLFYKYLKDAKALLCVALSGSEAGRLLNGC